MSLESEIASLNVNLKDLIAVLSRTPAPVVATADKPKKEKVETIKPEVVTRDADTDRKEAEPVIQELLNKQKKPEILKLNAEFGVKRFGELCGTDKFPAYLDAAKKLNAA